MLERSRFSLRPADAADQPFLVEMARHVCTLEGRSLLAADDPDVAAFVPDSLDAVVVAVGDNQQRLGAAWWLLHDPPLLVDHKARPIPELRHSRGRRRPRKGNRYESAQRARRKRPRTVSGVTLNVHLLNPAVRLYIRAGFKVAAAGRGWYGVTMTLPLDS